MTSACYCGVWTVVVLLSVRACVWAATIAPDNPNIRYSGVKYVSRSADGSVAYSRFSEETYKADGVRRGFNNQKARATTGIAMLFRTDSKAVRLTFTIPPDAENRSSTFGIYQNGVWDKVVVFSKRDRVMDLELVSQTPGAEVAYEIVFPNWSNPTFAGMTLDDGASLVECRPRSRKVYVAMGDSITHGTGQAASFQTYPFILARAIDYELYNVAVGGGRISLATADMLKDWEHIDLITILIGWNDWRGIAGTTPAQYKAKYAQMLDIIRTHHPETRIFCLTLVREQEGLVGKKSRLSADGFREAVVDIVSERTRDGDRNLFLVRSETFTDLGDYKGGPHFHEKGAKKFADSLVSMMRPKL